MSWSREILTTCLILSFIFIANGYSILLGSLPYKCFYSHAKVPTIIILLSSITYTVIAWVILMRKYIKMGLFYMMLPWLGLVSMLTSELWDWKSYGAWDWNSYGAQNLKSNGELASFGLGLFITICYCFLFLFRLLKLAVKQEPVQLCKGGIMAMKVVLICIVNGAVMMGNENLILEDNCKRPLTGAMLMLTTGVIGFALFCCQYNLEEEQEEVLPPPPLPPVQV